MNLDSICEIRKFGKIAAGYFYIFERRGRWKEGRGLAFPYHVAYIKYLESWGWVREESDACEDARRVFPVAKLDPVPAGTLESIAAHETSKNVFYVTIDVFKAFAYLHVYVIRIVFGAISVWTIPVVLEFERERNRGTRSASLQSSGN